MYPLTVLPGAQDIWRCNEERNSWQRLWYRDPVSHNAVISYPTRIIKNLFYIVTANITVSTSSLMSSSLKSALVSEALMSRSRKANLSSTIRNICIASIDKNFEKYFIAFSLYTWVKFLGILKNYIIIVEA